MYSDTVFIIEIGHGYKKGDSTLITRQCTVEIGDMENNKVIIKEKKAGQEVDRITLSL